MGEKYFYTVEVYEPSLVYRTQGTDWKWREVYCTNSLHTALKIVKRERKRIYAWGKARVRLNVF